MGKSCPTALPNLAAEFSSFELMISSGKSQWTSKEREGPRNFHLIKHQIFAFLFVDQYIPNFPLKRGFTDI